MSKFRTVEISDPRFEANNLRHITIKSKNLKHRGDISVFVPPGEDHKNLPIVLLLHGVYGSHWIWSQKTGIHLKMKSWIENKQVSPMILVMPSDGLWGDGSGYLPHNHSDFEQWIAEDVIDATIELIPQASKTSLLFITGLSMGGFGALRIGTKYGYKFSGVSGLSSITRLNEMKKFIEEDLSLLKQDIIENESVFETIMKHKKHLPKFRFDCGTSDSLLEGNRKLHHQLEEQGISHIYREYPGGHEWPYWEEHIKDTIHFFDDIINPKNR
ncbi:MULTISPECIES: alpha/beta hydrolase [Aquimarina]|uniref:Esterase family protein n=1 Tax=Aquimarina algiphila TaxID=2047982 RepID=A0A554VD24_9FLAO|nr:MULTISPECIES: alpha/beta hydrolase-fold protein [Aquimarina]TSE04715.1 esterase family protein [Aquimarina algiphila]